MKDRDQQKSDGTEDASERPSEVPAPTNAERGAAAGAPRDKRDSFIPLPDGFRQRKGRGKGSNSSDWRRQSLKERAVKDGAAPSGAPPAVVPSPAAAAAPAAVAPSPAPAQQAQAPASVEDVDEAWGTPASKPVASKPVASKPVASKPDALPLREAERHALPPEEPRTGALDLDLQPARQPQLIYTQAGNPTPEMPIVYRERAYAVESLLTDGELVECLRAELAQVQHELHGWEQVKYVQLALFDHKFQRQPSSPPLATLAWKDWRGEPVIWVRGAHHSGPREPLPESTENPVEAEPTSGLHGPATERGWGAERPDLERGLALDTASVAERSLEPALAPERRSAVPRPRGAEALAPARGPELQAGELSQEEPVSDEAPLPPRVHIDTAPMPSAVAVPAPGGAANVTFTPHAGFPAPAASDEVDWGWDRQGESEVGSPESEASPMPLVRRRNSPAPAFGDARLAAYGSRAEAVPSAAASPARVPEPVEPTPPDSGLDEEPIPLVSLRPRAPSHAPVVGATAPQVSAESLPPEPAAPQPAASQPAAPASATPASASTELSAAMPASQPPRSESAKARPPSSAPARSSRRFDKLAPESDRHDPSEDLIAMLFERMHELLFMPDIAAGAQYILSVLNETIPCEGVLIHVFDLNEASFVVVRAKGPNAERVLLSRTPDDAPRLKAVLRRESTLPSDAPKGASTEQAALSLAAPLQPATLWQQLGVQVEHALCGPVLQQGRRYLGLIELANPRGGGAFYKSEINALDYICEQFAEFVAMRPIVLEPDAIMPSNSDSP